MSYEACQELRHSSIILQYFLSPVLSFGQSKTTSFLCWAHLPLSDKESTNMPFHCVYSYGEAFRIVQKALIKSPRIPLKRVLTNTFQQSKIPLSTYKCYKACESYPTIKCRSKSLKWKMRHKSWNIYLIHLMKGSYIYDVVVYCTVVHIFMQVINLHKKNYFIIYCNVNEKNKIVRQYHFFSGYVLRKMRNNFIMK